MKKFFKNSTNKMIAGVCSGIAEYFDYNPTIVRLAFALFSLYGGNGLFLYLLAAVIIPERKIA